MSSEVGIEKRIIIAATIFVVALTGIIGLSVRMFGIGLPTCLNDVRPFDEGKVVLQAPKQYEIRYVAKMWKFEPVSVDILPGSTADIYVSTPDVTHGFQIVGTNVNLEVVPGAVNYARVRFDKPGDYLVVCNEYCGSNHEHMAAAIHVTDQATPPPDESSPEHEASEAAGHELLEKYDCTGCHSLDGSEGPGPTLKGLAGKTIQLEDGTTATATDEYIAEAINNPGAKLTKGFGDDMPPTPIPPAEVKAIIEYIKTIK